MLRHLKFSNFKSWPSLDMECGRITGIFGTNSSGKSSILQLILVLKQTRESTNQNAILELNGNYVTLGRYADIVGVSGNQKIEIGINILTPDVFWDKPKSLQPSSNGVNLVLELGIDLQDNIFPDIELRYSALGQSRSSARKKPRKSWGNVLVENQDGTSYSEMAIEPIAGPKGKSYMLPTSFKPSHDDDGDEERELRAIEWEDQRFSQIGFNMAFPLDPHVHLESFLSDVYYLGPLRVFPERNYIFSSSQPYDLGAAGQRCVDAILYRTNLEAVEEQPESRIPFQAKVASALKQIGLVSSFRMEQISEKASIWHALVKVRPTSKEVPLTDVGFGISQVLPVVTLLHYVPEKSVVLLEQPELHLHPLAQANLADFIIDVARERNLQIIVESHSEQFLLRLQRRVAEETIPADEIRLYFVDMIDGRSQLVKLDLDEFGSIRNWPKDFMGDAFGETAKAELARVKRRKRAQGE